MKRKDLLDILSEATRIAFGPYFVAFERLHWCVFDTNAKRGSPPLAVEISLEKAIAEAHDLYLRRLSPNE